MEKNSEQYLYELLSDDSFIRWVLFNEDPARWTVLLQENPDQRIAIQEAKRIIRRIYDHEKSLDPGIDAAQLWSKIKAGTFQEKPEVKQKISYHRLRPVLFAAAAVIAILATAAVYIFQTKDSGYTYDELVQAAASKGLQLIETVNNSDTLALVQLNDGSTIKLEPNSRIRYPRQFEDDIRRVYLSGKAFFDVAKNPAKPFYVYSNEVVTKVLGTSFTIRSFETDRQIVVDVYSGRVSVFNQKKSTANGNESEAIVLLPNQRAIYSKTTENFGRALVHTPMPLKEVSATRKTFKYDEVKVTEVLKALDDMYGVHILFNEEQLSSCIVTTTIVDGSLYDNLDLVCKIIGANYKEVDAQIIIESQEGCN